MLLTFVNCSARVAVAASGVTRSPSKRIFRGTRSPRPEIDPSGRQRMAMLRQDPLEAILVIFGRRALIFFV